MVKHRNTVDKINFGSLAFIFFSQDFFFFSSDIHWYVVISINLICLSHQKHKLHCIPDIVYRRRRILFKIFVSENQWIIYPLSWKYFPVYIWLILDQRWLAYPQWNPHSHGLSTLALITKPTARLDWMMMLAMLLLTLANEAGVQWTHAGCHPGSWRPVSRVRSGGNLGTDELDTQLRSSLNWCQDIK